MSEHEKSLDALLGELRAGYNPPPETPREEMWGAIRDRLPEARQAEVVELAARRRAPVFRRTAGWAVAAAALLVLGVGIGRMSAPDGSSVPAASTEVASASGATPLRAAAVEHLEGTEALLGFVRSDASRGSLDPQLRLVARGMLTQTRLFLDAQDGIDPELRRLMEDLELILAQIVTATEEDGRTRQELELALEGLEDRDFLNRIRTLSAPGMAGT